MVAAGLGLFAAPLLAADATTVADSPPAAVPYGGWVLAPAVSAILLAILTRQVVPSLFLGVLVASFMMWRTQAAADAGVAAAVVGTMRQAVEVYLVEAAADPDHVKVMLFTLIIGGMVGVVGQSGGTAALVGLIARRASSPRRGQLTAWAAGLVVFFDDYANTMIVGPTMQPICDRLRISRAKLAYIVDSTAAPVASIALVGTWVGAELDFIREGLNAVAAAGTPEFLAGVNAWQAFVRSIPYRFYAVLAIVLVALVAWTRRDIGPMRRAEAAEIANSQDTSGPAEDAPEASHWLLAFIPIGLLVGVTAAVLVWPGWVARREALAVGQTLGIDQFFAHADSYNAILYGAVISAIGAVAVAVGSRRLALGPAMDALVAGMARVFPAIVVLVLAWSLSAGGVDLKVGEVVSGWLRGQGFSFNWLPLGVFASAAFVSFATGTSWGTMGILCPMVVRVSADLGAQLPVEEALPLFYASVGSVLSGAIFGDHCSPISDTTVLSSIASGCPLGTHVWTQLPYALITATVAMLAGDTLCSKLGQSPWTGLGVGAVLLVVAMYALGRKPAREEPGPRP
jgi:Na+/H+ antiporter NhaC